ncbi:unnamed protein product [Timema podura]|uniref:Uncharacterized protein n=1 Tax=Timema podura TaxID=61482 RepID=A0ABN7NB78_TIMPD|nr:unnamed protein product [Timema podura]
MMSLGNKVVNLEAYSFLDQLRLHRPAIITNFRLGTTYQGCIRIVHLCGVALTRALDKYIDNHVTKCRSVQIVMKDVYAPFSRSWSPWIRRLPAMRCSRVMGKTPKKSHELERDRPYRNAKPRKSISRQGHTPSTTHNSTSVVLSPTAEDGEIEVRISLGSIPLRKVLPHLRSGLALTSRSPKPLQNTTVTKQNRRGVHPIRANRIEARKRNMHPQGGSEQDKQGSTDIESEQNVQSSKNCSPMDTKTLEATTTIVSSSEENQDMNGGDDEPLSKLAKHETKNIEDSADNTQTQSNGDHHEVNTNEQENSNVGDLNNTEKFVATIVKDSVGKQEEPVVADKTTKSFAPHVEVLLGSYLSPIVSVNRLKEGVTTQQNGNESLDETSERNESVTAEEVDISGSEYSLKLSSSTEESSFKSSQEPQKYIDISFNSNKANEEHLERSSNDAEKSPSKSEKANTVSSKVQLDVPSRYLYSDRSQTPSPRRSTRLTTLKYEAMVNLNEISVESIDEDDDLVTGHSQSFIHSSTDQNRIATKLNVSEGNIPTEAGPVSHKLPLSTIKGRKSYRSPTSNTFPVTASTSTYISKYIRDTHSVAVAGPSGLSHNTSESGRKTPSESGRKTPSESGRKTPSESGRKTPSEGGHKTSYEYGRNTPSESGRTTPAESGRNTPSESGRATPLEIKKTGRAALTTATKIISSENYLVREPDTDLADTTDESDVEMNESLALLCSRSAKRKEPSLIKEETKRAKLSPGPSFAHFNINFSPPFSYLGGRVTKQATALDESEFDSTAEEASNYHCSNTMSNTARRHMAGSLPYPWLPRPREDCIGLVCNYSDRYTPGHMIANAAIRATSQGDTA